MTRYARLVLEIELIDEPADDESIVSQMNDCLANAEIDIHDIEITTESYQDMLRQKGDLRQWIDP